MDTKTLIALIIVFVLIVSAFFLGRHTIHPEKIYLQDTIIVSKLKIDTIIIIKKEPKIIKQIDTVNLYEYYIAALDTTLPDKTRLEVLYEFPPINTFRLMYQAHRNIDTIIVNKYTDKIIYRDKDWTVGGNLWLSGMGVDASYRWYGAGIGYNFRDKQPYLYLRFNYNF